MSSIAAFFATGCALAGGDFAPFTEESAARGLNYAIQPPPLVNGLYGFGVAAADLDGDGDQDIIAAGRVDRRIGIFLNDGLGNFANHTSESLLPQLIAPSALLVVDLDGDRLPELLVTQINAPIRAFANLGGARFGAHALDGGFGPPAPTKAISTADIDGDGDLDFFIANYALNDAPSAAHRNRLLRNEGDRLVDLAPTLGMDAPARSFLGIFSDIDGDGDPDLYVSNDRGHHAPFHAGNQLWINGGAGAYTRAQPDCGAEVQCFSMGVACGDFDLDGSSDFLVTNLPSRDPPVFGVNPLLLGDGHGSFVRAESLWQVEDQRTGWGALFVDLDDSGTLDLFVNHQGSDNGLWLNPGSPPAVEIPAGGGAAGVPNRWNYSTAAADFDGDGDLDLVSLGLGANLRLYMNHAGDARPSTRIRIEGIGANRDAVGATLLAQTSGVVLRRELIVGGHGYLGQNELEVHLGFGDASMIDEAIVRFPDGTVRRVGPLSPGSHGVVHSDLLGDGDGDGALDDADLVLLDSCIGSPAGPTSPCRRFDLDGDLTVTREDRAAFALQRRHRAADIVADRRVDARDLGALLEEWGAGGRSDLDGDGTVACEDLALLLAAWGERPY